MFRPAYLSLSRQEIKERTQKAVASLGACKSCPRGCDVNRLNNEWSVCKTGRFAVVNSCFPHMGEEDCLRGWNGSGTLFFTHCNLKCVFCQNYDISQTARPGQQGSTPETLADRMMNLQVRGCHNVNFVTPEHVVPQVLEGLEIAITNGLSLPIVYNTSAYDALESLTLMNGIVDIYMPDFKFWTGESASTYLKAKDYPEKARHAIKEMFRQVGDLILDENGIAQRGLLIRHLVMPGFLEETYNILEWIASTLGRNTYVNLMDQYHPSWKVSSARYQTINRTITSAEMREAQTFALDLGLRLDKRKRW